MTEIKLNEALPTPSPEVLEKTIEKIWTGNHLSYWGNYKYRVSEQGVSEEYFYTINGQELSQAGYEEELYRIRRNAWRNPSFPAPSNIQSNCEGVRWKFPDGTVMEHRDRRTPISKKIKEKVAIYYLAGERAHKRKLTWERKKKNEDEAKKKGLTLEELMAERRKKYENSVANKKGNEVAKNIQNLAKVGPVLRGMDDNLKFIMNKMANLGGEVPKIPYFNNRFSDLHAAANEIRWWREFFRSLNEDTEDMKKKKKRR